METLTEEFVRHQLRLLLRNLGLPEAKDIGQHEIVSNDKLEALDAAVHDEALLIRALVGRSGAEAVAAFQSIQCELRTEGLKKLSESNIRSRFAHSARG